MKNGTCTACGSHNVYKSANNSWYQSGIKVAVLGDKVNEVFMTEAYVCLDCRHLELVVEENAAAIFGKGKAFKDAVPASTNWKKVAG
ncbi:MAG: hypothetical protein U0V18_03690 [Anaerolineales bacterium]